VIRAGFLLALFAATAAAKPARAVVKLATADPFRPPDPQWRPGIAVMGWRGRLGEELAHIRESLKTNPAEVATLERALPVMKSMGRLGQFQAVLEQLGEEATDGSRIFKDSRLDALLGHVIVETMGVRWDLPDGMDQAARRRLLSQIRKLSNLTFGHAQKHLRIAIRANPKDARSRRGLARVLELLDPKKHAEEIEKLRNEAAALLLRSGPAMQPIDLSDEVMKLRTEAEALEQRERNPKHAEALELRKQALIYDYCSHTIPFGVEVAQWKACALLAPRHMVTQNLTRTFRNTKGEIASVEPQYFDPPYQKRFAVLDQLGQEQDETAAAILLAYLRRARAETTLTDAALTSAQKLEAVRENLPGMLKTALASSDETEFHPLGRRLLIRLAGRMKLDVAPLLEVTLRADTSLLLPLGTADALGRIGAADALLEVARDKTRALHFRREAALALGLAAPDRLVHLQGDPDLEIALAAARHRNVPDRVQLDRILKGFDDKHEAAVAAQYCLAQEIREGLGIMDTWLAQNPQHYARDDIKRIRIELRAKLME